MARASTAGRSLEAMARASTDRRRGAATGERILIDLLALEREILELHYVRRTDALERVSDAVRRLGELPSTEGILARAAAELGAGSELDRILISEVVDGRITPLTIWAGDRQEAADAALADLSDAQMPLEYPLIEFEVARRHGAEVVSVAAAGARTPAPLARSLGWESYAVAALTIGAETIGLLHADAAERPLDALDGEVVGRYGEALSGVFERAVLRHTLDLHRAELSSAVQWMSTRLTRLQDAAGLISPRLATGDEHRLVEALTPRELDVLRLMARGNTNLAIANALVVREGTIKYHVKNILRKLGATSRADAVARFVRAGGSEATR
jgi:LuxR family transcriptional regulator, regulator of acetate metabolism